MLITLYKALCCPAHISVNVKLGRTVLQLKKTAQIEYMKLYWKGPEIYRFSRSATQNFLRWPAMVTEIFKDFEPPSKKFLTMSL